MSIKLWHCGASRSVRPLWTLEEMQLEHELAVMPFPPRFMQPGYTDLNPIGTVPYFTDGAVEMTESTGICEYLVRRYGPTELAIDVDEEDYGAYLNWLYRSDATFTFPQTIVLRYTVLEPEERRLQQAVEDYTQWLFSRLRSLESGLQGREYLCGGRFTIADICVGYALYFSRCLKLTDEFKPNTEAYYQRITARPAFERATRFDADSPLL